MSNYDLKKLQKLPLSFNRPTHNWVVCPWDSIPGKVLMVAECILEMESSSARNRMIPLANVDQPQPRLVCVVRPLEELTRAIQGERIWHEEE